MRLKDSMELMKKYGDCPECGSNKVGKGSGALLIQEYIFTRSCQCGWGIIVDRRIKHVASMTKKRSNKLVGGVYEVAIHGKGRKLLPLLELKELAGVSRVNQHAKIEEWLNGEKGRKWALEVPEECVH